MSRLSIFPLVAVLAVGAPPSVQAQASERSFERMIESIASAAERMAHEVERSASRLAIRFEREFNRRDGRWEQERERQGRRRDDVQWQEPRTSIDTTIAFSSNGLIELTNLSGDIVVTGWDRKDAHIKAQSERGEFEFELSSSRIILQARSSRGTRGERGGRETRYELKVPRGVRVVANSMTGEVTITGTGGSVEAGSISGDVAVDDASGRSELTSVSGDVSGKRIKGDVEATSVSGQVELQDVEGRVRSGTTSGDIVLTRIISRNLEASTTSGDIEFEGGVESDGRYEFNSHSGDISLVVPSATSARFAVESFSGSMESDFAVTLQPTDRSNRRQRRFEFSVGGGGAHVVAETFSGDVNIRRR